MAGVVPIPDVAINFVPSKAGEIYKLGPITCRVMEDGSRTDNRLGSVELILPPHAAGPPPHWHEMHDEAFLVLQGTIRFHVPDKDKPGHDKKTVDARAGDYMVVPIRAPHTFSNPTDEEARVFLTCTPSFYINYFKLLSQLSEADKPLPAEVSMTAMSMFATLQVDNKPRTNS